MLPFLLLAFTACNAELGATTTVDEAGALVERVPIEGVLYYRVAGVGR